MFILNKIITLLKEQGKSQKELCEYLGIKQQAFTNWKGGNNTAYMKHLPQIAKFLDVSVDYLLEEENAASTSRSETLPDILYRFPELSDDRKKEVLAFVEFKLAQQLDDQKG